MVKIPSGGNDIAPDELMKALEEVMAPYQENNMGDCPPEYMEFNDVEEEYREKWESGEETVQDWYAKRSLEVSKQDYERLQKEEEATIFVERRRNIFTIIESEDKCSVAYRDDGKWSERIYAEAVDVVKNPATEDKAENYTVRAKVINPPNDIPVQKYYGTFEKYIEEYAGYSKDEKTGKYGYWENPQAKWDWYQVGGRWPGLLKIKTEEPMRGGPSLLTLMDGGFEYEEGTGDFAKIKDIDFEEMNADVEKKTSEFYDKMERFVKIQNGEIEQDKEKDIWLSIDMHTAIVHGAGHYDGEGKDAKFIIDVSREEFLEKFQYIFEFGTWAVVENGEWHEKAKMGWWACHNGTKEQVQEFDKSFTKRFLENEDPETYIAIVDCHI
jgi:hypothetical protein